MFPVCLKSLVVDYILRVVSVKKTSFLNILLSSTSFPSSGKKVTLLINVLRESAQNANQYVSCRKMTSNFLIWSHRKSFLLLIDLLRPLALRETAFKAIYLPGYEFLSKIISSTTAACNVTIAFSALRWKFFVRMVR